MDTAAAASTVNNDVVDILILAGLLSQQLKRWLMAVVCLLGYLLGNSIQYARGNTKEMVRMRY